MGIGQIIIFSLIGVGVLAVIVALVYTKIIKPSTFGYTSTSYLAKIKLKKIFKQLIETKKIIKGFDKVVFDSPNLMLAIIDYIYFGNDFIYLVTNPLYWNIKEVKEEKNKLLLVTNKNKELTLPLDVEIFLKSIKHFTKLCNVSEQLIVIVPCLNKQFSNSHFNKIDFIKMTNINSFVSEKEKSDINNIETLQKDIVSKMKKQKNKRRLFPKFSKDI